jgi:hypothetical protein
MNARSRPRVRLLRRDATQGGAQGRALLLHVRPEILLDEDHAGCRDYAKGLNDPNAMGLTQSGIIEDGHVEGRDES